MDFRDALKRFRSELGITQMELANALHINSTTVGRWESGKTRPNRSISAALIEYAKVRRASPACQSQLRRAALYVAKERVGSANDGLHAMQHALFNQLVDEASFPLYICDMETDDILYANEKAEAIMGRDLDRMPSRKCYQCFMHRETPCEFCHKNELVTDRFTRQAMTREEDGVSYQILGKRIAWNGRDAHVRYILRDGSTQLLKSIIEDMNGGVFVVIYDGEGDVRNIYANHRFYELFGYTKRQYDEELKAPYAVVLPEDDRLVQTRLDHVRATGQADTFRYRARKRDGGVIFVRCNASTASIEGLGDKVLLCVLNDITAAVEAERKALISGQRLSTLMGNINNGVAASIMHENGAADYIFVTDRYYEMLGYTREQYHQEVSDPFDLIFSEDAARVREAAAALRDIHKTCNLTYRAVRRDGQIIWLDVNITIMSFADVKEPVQLSIFTDITHMVKANELLAAQRSQINDMMNTTPGGIAIVEVNRATGSMRTTYYNDSFFSYSGYTREEYDAILRQNELSFVFDEDVPVLLAAMENICAGDTGRNVDATVRCRTKDGGYRWLLLTAQLAKRSGDVCVINIVMVDITRRKAAEDRQRITEEMLRIAAETDKRTLITYNVKANTCHVESRNLYSAFFGETFENVPESLIDLGVASSESIADLCALFDRIRSGEKSVQVSLLLRTGNQEYQWFECNASTVYDADGKPDHAVLVFHNITEQRIKEAVFRKWQQSISSRPPESYTLFRCNLSKDASIDEQDGKLLRISFPPEVRSFNSRTKVYAEQFVYTEDQEAYVALLDSDTLLAMFYRGEHSAALEYREISPNGVPLWRLLTVEMVEYLNSTDVQAFLMYEDIDEKKREELNEIERTQNDPLTGVLNRVAFAEKVDAIIARDAGSQHAMLMMDMDGFKQLNDTFGHAAGDQALMDTAAVMRALVREGDLICRLGGDEFLIWLRAIPYDAVIDKIARQLCEQVQKAFSQEVKISVSVGVSVYPRDGHDFDELYRNADKALYRVKKTGKNNYAFFSADERAASAGETEILVQSQTPDMQSARTKRRMLIVDDDAESRAALSHIFQDEYLIETAKSGTEAMLRLRHFNTAISIVLLDLHMPGMDGYEVLRKIQANVDLRTIPVIVVSAHDDRESLLKAIECGACDYVSKPVDVELIRLRVKSAVSKAENERLRAQNSYLQLQRDEELKFHTVLESTGTVVIEYDWRNHVFVYANDLSKYLAGNYNHRSLWQVFLSDMVADSADVKALQDGLLMLANDREQTKYSKLVSLRTPTNHKHWFRMNVYKQVDAFGLAEKMIITFNDVHEEVLSNQKLLFQATRDELTGLYNRSGFIEKSAEMIAAQAPGFYVMSCVDIEKFKVINDQYGTKKGDDVLKQFASLLLTFFKNRGGVCCRVTADNFAALYPASLIDTPEIEEAHREMEKLDGSIPSLRFSAGRCLIDEKTLDISAIYDRATIAKHTVKGRYDTNIATYDESMRTSILRQQEITGQMKNALETGQFEVWLQPQFNHATGLLIGSEALVRWRHPVEGIIAPGEFIPIFEQNGFVYEVDKFVWEQTCRLLRKWLDQNLRPVPVSVNISRYDVFRDDLVDIIKGLVKKYDLPMGLLRLEITESAFSKSTDQIINVVKAFIEAGFIVEIDDFGSGYSSLNTLKDVPAQVLKMDMRFLENDENAQRGGSIIESVVRMARWLGMSVIAEGVETIEQADYLKSIGCELVQGYLYARPTCIEEYEKLFAQGNIEPIQQKLESVKAWNNNAFWNPKSMETLIFNSYVGGACIFEYRDGKTELLRYNDRYAEIFGKHTRQSDKESRGDVFASLDGENARQVRGNIETAMRTKKESTCESRLARADGGDLYVRITVRQIAQAGDRSLFYCVVADITAQRVAERDRREAASRIAAIMDNVNGGITAVVLQSDGTMTYLLVNDRYFGLLGYTRAQYEREGVSGLELMHPDDQAAYKHQILSLHTPGQRQTFEFRARRRDGRWVWLRCDIAVVSLKGIEAPVQLSCFTDITQRMETDERLHFINELAGDILAQPDADQAIGNTLERMMTYFEANRSYIVELDGKALVSSNTYEVCAPGISSEKARLQNLPYSETDLWYTALSGRNCFVVEDVDALADGSLRKLLKDQNIRSVVLAPLLREGRLIGFAGVDNPARVPKDTERFTAPADYLAILLTRRDLSRDIARGNAEMKRLIDDTPGGFCRIALHPGKHPTLVALNEGFCRLLDMTGEEARALYGEDMYKCFVMEDVKASVMEARDARAHDKQYTARCRMRRKNGETLWVMAFGRFDRDDEGNSYLNIYFSDIAQRKKLEDLRVDLMDNLACGVALYEYDGKRVSVIHINKSYWKLIGRERVDYSNADVISVVHPEDKPVLMLEIASCIRQKRDFACDFRILNGEGGYTPFHVVASVEPEENGNHLFYATYMPISKKTMSIQEMIPVAISTMMSASENISYVTDRDLHYVCCSKSLADIAGLADPHEAIGRTAQELFAKKYADKFAADDARVIATKAPIIGMTEHMPAAGGKPHIMHTSKYPILDAAGAVVGVYCLSIDITAQKEKESLLELLTSAIPGGLAAYSVTKAGIRTLYFNEGYYAYSGYTREEYLEMTARDPLALIVEEDRPNLHAMLAGFTFDSPSGTQGKCTYRCRLKDGGCRWMSLKAVLSQMGEESYVLNVVQLDISDQVEAKNRQTELLDSLPCGAALYEYDGGKVTAIHINKRYWALVGREPDEMISVMDGIYPGDRSAVLEEVASAIRQKRDARIDARVRYGCSEYRAFHISANILPQSKGKYILAVSYIPIDEGTMSMQEMLPIMLSAMLTTSDDLAFIKDRDGRFIACSKAAVTYTGLASERDIVGKTSAEVFGEDAVKPFAHEDQWIFESGRPLLDREIRLPTPTQNICVFRTSKYPLLDGAGKVVGIYILCRDVTREKTTQFELDTLLRVIPSGVMKYSADEKTEFAYVNHNFILSLGYTQESFKAKFHNRFLTMIWAEDRAKAKAEILAQETDGKIGRFDYRVEDAHGELHWFHDEGVKVTDENGKAWYYVTLVDITAQKRARQVCVLGRKSTASPRGTAVTPSGATTSLLRR